MLYDKYYAVGLSLLHNKRKLMISITFYCLTISFDVHKSISMEDTVRGFTRKFWILPSTREMERSIVLLFGMRK